jgi:hypothetical protein
MMHNSRTVTGNSAIWFRLPQLILIGFGLVIMGVALTLPALRRHDGWLNPLAWPIAMVGMSLMVAGLCRHTVLWRAGVLLGVALAGQAAALALVDISPHGIIQHYAYLSDLFSSPRGLFLLGPVVQAAAIVWWGRPYVRRLLHWARRSHPLKAAALAGLLVLTASTFPLAPVRVDIDEMALAGLLALLNLLNLLLAAAYLPDTVLKQTAGWWQQFEQPSTQNGLRARLVPGVVAGWVVLVSALISGVVLDRVPHIPDSVMYLFQAKYFSAGQLYLPAPADMSAFWVEQTVHHADKFYGIFPPGWPLVLAVGVRLGAPWLVNPVLGGITVLLAFALVQRLYNRRTALVVILLLAVSPWFLFMSASYMAHPVSLIFAIGSVLAADNLRRAPAARWGLLAGACLGCLALVRPMEGLIMAAPVGVWAVWPAVGAAWGNLLARFRRRMWPLALTGLTAALLAGLGLLYNQALTGRAGYFPIMQWFDQTWYPGVNRLGFGPDVGNTNWGHLDPWPGHSPLEALLNAHQNFFSINVELFGWGFGSLLLVFFMLLHWRQWRAADWLMLGSVAAVIAAYSLYWFSGGPDFGARYWYLALLPLVILTARGFQTALSHWPAPRLGALLFLAGLITLLSFMPWRSVGRYHNYRGLNNDMARLAHRVQFGPALVFVQHRYEYDYARAFVQNPPTLAATERGPIYARDQGQQSRDRLVARFPQRPVWFVKASAGGLADPFEIVAGPLPPGTVGRFE